MMPLSDFLRMARGQLESAQENTASPTVLSSAPENDLVELVWENGQIMMQGQTNRAKKNTNTNDFSSQTPGIRERYMGNATIPKLGKFGGIESPLNDAAPSVPSGETYLIQEDDMGPWLDYSMDDGFSSDFCSDILPDVSGVTGDEIDLGVRNASRVSSSRADLLSPYSSQPCQISVPSAVAGAPSVVINTPTIKPDEVLGNSVRDQASSAGFLSMKMQKQKVALPGRGSSLLNFSHFSKPAALYRANLEKSDDVAAACSSGTHKVGIEKVSAATSTSPIKSTQIKPSSNSQKDICFHSQPKLVSTKVDSRPSVDKPSVQSCGGQQSDALLRDNSIKNDKSSNPVIGPSTTIKVKDGENPVEPVVAASSVCSGNSGEGASNDHIHTLKRKHRDHEASESRSEDTEEESVSIKKAAHARGGSGSKRSRAAEVHNLSERKRRDRINEKMRALQELIPNCNKADKASMLDEAIEYLKTLQLQVQMMSMGAGLLPPMMFPTGLQQMHATHVPHFPTMGGGMGMGMGFGMGMLDMNSQSPRFPMFQVPPMQGPHFAPPPISGSSTFQGLAGSNLQVFGHTSQVFPVSVPRAPFVPSVGQAPINSAVGMDASRMGTHAVQNTNSQPIHNADTGSSINKTSSELQATTKDFDKSAVMPINDQSPDVCAAACVS